MSAPRVAGTIYDLGYQGYAGERLGRLNAVLRLVQYSFKQAYAVGRGQRARTAPMIISVIVFLPVIVQIAIASFTGNIQIINFGGYLEFTAFIVALFTASQAPELLVSDRKHGVLSLYLSRPMRGTDYALAKLAAMVISLLVLTFIPQFAMWIARIFLQNDAWAGFKTELPKLLPLIGGTFGTSLYMASIGLAISSFCTRRAFANAGIIAYFMLLPAAVQIIQRLSTGDTKRYITLAHPMWLLTGFTNWLFDIQARGRSGVARADLPGSAYLWGIIGVSTVFVAVLCWRYRRSEA